MKLATPAEPKDLRNWMESLRAKQLPDPDIDWDSFIVWAGNKLPKYLWDQWKDNLKPRGFTWQKFMKLLRYRTDISVLWYKGMLPWSDFIKGTVTLIEGPIGASLAAGALLRRKAIK